jgi:prepilin-type N-terminal cleavage/methylation domain-containing protein
MNQKGFTITELLVAMTAGSIIALTVLSISLFYFSDVMAANAETRLTIEAQTVNRLVAEDMRTATRILTAATLPDANAPVAGWNTSNADLILVLSVPATDVNKNFIFNASTGEPFQNEYIFFEEGGNLFKRVLADTTAPGNVLATSCPEPLVTPSCLADRLLSDSFNTMNFTFFDQDNVITADPLLGRSININIFMEQTVFGQTVRAQNNIRMTLRNAT